MKVERINLDGGRVSLQAEGDVITLCGDMDQPSPKTFLGPFLDQVHTAAQAEGLHAVTVDLLGLRFLNSSAVKEIITWLLRRNHLPAGKKYVVEFIFDSSILWQRVSLPTLSQLDPDFVILTDRTKSTYGR